MRVINWLDLQPTDEELSQVLSKVTGVTKTRVVLWQLVRTLLYRYPWDGRDRLVEVFDSSHLYDVGDTVALPRRDEQGIRPDSWRVAAVKRVEDTDNPVQGSFRVVSLEVDGKEKLYACNVDAGAQLPLVFPEANEQKLDMLADDLVEAYRPQLEGVLLRAIEDGRVDVLVLGDESLCGKEWVVLPDDVQVAVEDLFHGGPEEGMYIQTAKILEILRSSGWFTDLPDEVACFCINDYLEQREDAYESLGFSRWIAVSKLAKIDRQVERKPKVPRVASAVAREQGEDDSPDFQYYEEVKLDQEAEEALRQMGDEHDAVPSPVSLDEWRRSAPTQPMKLPTITYQNLVQGFFPLTSSLSRWFPPAGDKVAVDIQVIEGDTLPFLVDWEEGVVKALDKEAFRLKFVEQALPAGTHLWLERRSNTEYRVRPKPLPQPRQVRCKFARMEDGKLKITTDHVEIRYESDAVLFKSELRFLDVDALFEEAKQLGWSVFDAMYYTFPELVDTSDTEQRVHHTELFNAVFFRYRMCSPRSVQTELYRRPCFVSLGDGCWRFDPSLGIRPRPVNKMKREVARAPTVRPTVRRPKRRAYSPSQRIRVGPKTPPTEQGVWLQIAKLEGQDLETLDEGNRFKVVKVGDNHVELLLSQTGMPRRVERREIEPAWEELIREGNISRSTIHRGYSEWNPPYVSAILAALPGVTHKTKPIRLFYHGEAKRELEAGVPDIGLREILFPIPFADRPLSKEIRESFLQQAGAVQRGFDFIDWEPTTTEQLDDHLQELVADRQANRFVTPREVVDLMVNLAQPRPGERAADICCGTGIFLVKAWRFVQEVYGERERLYLSGADIYAPAVDAARLNLGANGVARFVLLEADSLEGEGGPFAQHYDLILGNPPFGGGSCHRFIRRWTGLLKNGGRMVVNVSESVLANAGRTDRELRVWLLSDFAIDAVISLPRPSDSEAYGAKSNVLLLRKMKTDEGHETVLAEVEDYSQIRGLLDVLHGRFG